MTLLSHHSVAHAIEYIVLLHGIFRTSSHMQPLADYLEGQGYEVINIDYPSTKHSLEELIEMTSTDLNALMTDKTRRVHFVGYSMGGLLARGIVKHHRPENLGSVVLLGTPNHGSEVADFWQKNFLYKKLYGPAGQQLTTDYDLSPLLGKVDYDLGVIAGNFSIDPISSLMITGPDDGKVSIESTKLEGMTDHIILSTSHTFFPRNKEVKKQVLAFLKESKFLH